MKRRAKQKHEIKALDMHYPGEAPRVVLFVAFADHGAMIGSVSLRFGSNKKQAEFSRLFTDPSYRQRGVARQLLEHAGRVAKNAGARSLTAYVNKTNDHAMAFYEREGFQQIYDFADGDHLIWRAL